MNLQHSRFRPVVLTAAVVALTWGCCPIGAESVIAPTGPSPVFVPASAPSLEAGKLPARGEGPSAVTELRQWARPVLALGLVAGLIWALRCLLRRWGKALPGASGGVIEVVGRTPMSPRSQLILVKLGRRLVLVGAWHGGAAALSEVTDSQEVAELLAAAGRVSASTGSGTAAQKSSGGNNA